MTSTLLIVKSVINDLTKQVNWDNITCQFTKEFLIVRSVTNDLMRQVNSDIITCQFMKDFLIVRSLTNDLMKQVNSDIIMCQFMKEFFNCEKCDKWFNEAGKLKHYKVIVHEVWLRHLTFANMKIIYLWKIQKIFWLCFHFK